ncbi:MAG: branched-chain amino acid ABC transporter permease [Limnochordaceae bacterium]|nr:branched-chain amino acid ABC transporter permease [Limnochordaceae bacterium]
MWARLGATTGVALLLVAYPLLFPGALNVGVTLVLFAALAYAWDVLGGWAGQLSLGHAALVGLGAYTFGLLTQSPAWTRFGAEGIGLALAGTAAVAAVATLLWGWIAFRLRGPYFTLSTIAVAEILRLVATNERRWTGGAEGLFLANLPPVAGLDPFDRTVEYYAALVLLGAAMAGAWWLSRSRFGYYLQAIREDEDAAMALGIAPLRYKLQAFALSGVATALGGALYAVFLSFFEPHGVFDIGLSIQIALVAIIGGTGTLFGPLIGSAVLVLSAEFFRASFREANLLIYGILIVLVVRFAPQGIVGTLGGLERRWRARHEREAAAHPAVEGLERGLRGASGPS